MTAGVGQLQCQIPYLMVAEIKAQILALSHGQVMDLVKLHLFRLGAVAVLQLKTAHRLHDGVVQNGIQLFRCVQQLCIVQRVKALHDMYQRHMRSSSFDPVRTGSFLQ